MRQIRRRRLLGWSGHPRSSRQKRATPPTAELNLAPEQSERVSAIMQLVLCRLYAIVSLAVSQRHRTEMSQLELARRARAANEQELAQAQAQGQGQGTKAMPGITPAELANLLDAGLEPEEISYLCFTRWRYRRGELNEGLRRHDHGDLTLPETISRPRRPQAKAPLGRFTV